jgi:hypothetical protein
MRLKNILVFTLFLFISSQAATDWAGLQNTLIKYYRYQRSGLASGNPYNPFYTTTGSGTDANKYPHWYDAADGGWYDAGDFVKFGLPMGFSVYCMLKGYDAFTDPDCYSDNNSWSTIGTKDNIPDILNEAKVGTDYLIKAVISSSSIIRDIGTGTTDHQAITESGYGNSTRTYSSRPATYCDGADVPAYYAAALALMSILYKPYSTTYSDSCLTKAKLAYTYASSKSAVCTEQSDGSTTYYACTQYKDKLACAAIELYRATGTASYLTAAKTYFSSLSPHYDVLSFGYAGDLASYTLARNGDSTTTGSYSYLSSSVSMEISRIVGGNVLVTGASVNTTDWGVCATVGNAAFSAALLYNLTGDVKYKNFALQQLNWLSGSGSYSKSWITQSGSNYPNHPHHRNDYNLSSVARLTGGVVSGPTSSCSATDKSTCSWSFTDDASQYKYTETALNYGCGAIGACALMRWLAKTTDTVVVDTGLSATPASLDLTSGSETITATLAKSASWTVVLKGATSGATKKYTGTGTKISITGWKGDADAGKFTCEVVNVSLDTATMKVWNVQRLSYAATTFNITNVAVTAFGANDKVVDNFEDTILLTNTLSGTWSLFYDKGDSISGGASGKPSILSDSGRNSAKGIYFTLVRNTGATCASGPYAGIRTTFNAAGSAVNLGSADTIMFDIKPKVANTSLYVELEQSNITDKAYFSYPLTLGVAGSWVRVYIPFSSLTQPSWKTSTATLATNKAVALRFTGYGKGTGLFSLDNIYISNLNITSNSIRSDAALKIAHGKNAVDFYKTAQGSISYGLFMDNADGKEINAELFDCLGKKIMSYNVDNYKSGKLVNINCNLHAGIYFLRHTVADTKKAVIATFMVNK